MIDFLRKILVIIINSNRKKEANIINVLNEIRNSIPKSKIQFNFTLNKNIIITNQRSFEELTFYLLEFFEAYETLIKHVKENKINNILVEFNNTLSHILFAIENNETFKVNINRAKSHLYRAILDCYKEILILNKNLIKDNEYQYIKIRKKEALHIGKTEDIKKEIIREYKNLLKSKLLPF